MDYSVGFSLDEAGTLRPIQTDAYCFFKTKEHTGLNFFIHAPFKLNDSREHIVAGEPHNHNMINLLAHDYPFLHTITPSRKRFQTITRHKKTQILGKL